jgi:hypothetical protein
MTTRKAASEWLHAHSATRYSNVCCSMRPNRIEGQICGAIGGHYLAANDQQLQTGPRRHAAPKRAHMQAALLPAALALVPRSPICCGADIARGFLECLQVCRFRRDEVKDRGPQQFRIQHGSNQHVEQRCLETSRLDDKSKYAPSDALHRFRCATTGYEWPRLGNRRH